MLTLEERIIISYNTLEFIEEKLKQLEEKINVTSGQNELKKLIKEVNGWKQKCERENRIIEKIQEECGIF